jgi:hypothetical protein
MSGTYSDLEVWQAAMDLAEVVIAVGKDLSEGGVIHADKPIATSGSVRAQQHRRRQRAILREGTHPVPALFPRIT